jgi:hypothetical protein
MQTRIPNSNDSFDILNDREMIATRRIILRKLSARMEQGGFDVEKPVVAAFTRENDGQPIPAH